MVSSKCLHKKKRLGVVINNLMKDNAFLKKTLLELSGQHSDHLKLVERLIGLGNQTALPLVRGRKEPNRKDRVNLERISTCSREMENIKNKIVRISTRCQTLETKLKGKKDMDSDEQTPSSSQTELGNHRKDALEKNKQWLEYDQQREAFVRATMARMIWLEKQLNEAKEACSHQHKEDHSHEGTAIHQMQEYYERLLLKAKDELNVLREQLNITQQKLTTTQKWCQKKETEVEELKQLLVTKDRHCSDDEAKQLMDKATDLEQRLHKEKRRSATFELQMNLLQKYLLNNHDKDQEKIADLEQKLCSVMTSSPSSSVLNETLLTCPGCHIQYPATHYKQLMSHMEICLD